MFQSYDRTSFGFHPGATGFSALRGTTMRVSPRSGAQAQWWPPFFIRSTSASKGQMKSTSQFGVWCRQLQIETHIPQVSYNGAVMDEARLLIRLMQPELVLDFSRSINRVGDNIRSCQALRFVPKHNEFISVRVVLWVGCECLGLHLAKRVVSSGLECKRVNGIWLLIMLEGSSRSSCRPAYQSDFLQG